MIIVTNDSRLELGCICLWKDWDSRGLGMTWKWERKTPRISKISFDQSELNCRCLNGITRYGPSPLTAASNCSQLSLKVPFRLTQTFQLHSSSIILLSALCGGGLGRKEEKNKCFRFDSQDEILRIKWKLFESWLVNSNHLPSVHSVLISILVAFSSFINSFMKFKICYIDVIHKISFFFCP